MIEYPDRYAESFIKAGADILTVHVEPHSKHDVGKTLEMIRKVGCKPGLAINPPTELTAEMLPLLREVDLFLCMTVNPGFGGQAFIGDVMEKVKKIKTYCDEHELDVDIEVDGGINLQTAQVACQSGANALVAGTFLFKQKDMASVISEMREKAAVCF